MSVLSTRWIRNFSKSRTWSPRARFSKQASKENTGNRNYQEPLILEQEKQLGNDTFTQSNKTVTLYLIQYMMCSHSTCLLYWACSLLTRVNVIILVLCHVLTQTQGLFSVCGLQRFKSCWYWFTLNILAIIIQWRFSEFVRLIGIYVLWCLMSSDKYHWLGSYRENIQEESSKIYWTLLQSKAV